jgi:hypothetical protein
MSLKKQITLFGEIYLLIGDLDSGGPISTKEQYENFECSYAYLKSDGNIYRFGQVIGTKDDINISNTSIDVNQDDVSIETVFNALTNPIRWAHSVSNSI